MRAFYANPEGSDVLLEEDGGTRLALKPGDPRLEGLEIEAFVPPPTTQPAIPTMEQLLALRAQIDAALAALAQSQP